jgi:hypothetical protein
MSPQHHQNPIPRYKHAKIKDIFRSYACGVSRFREKARLVMKKGARRLGKVKL